MSEPRLLRDAMMSMEAGPCPSERDIAALHLGLLPAALAEAVREHIARCPRCLDVARDASTFAECMGAGSAITEVRRRAAYPWAAAAAAMILLGALLASQRWLQAPAPVMALQIDQRITRADYPPPPPVEADQGLVYRGGEESLPVSPLDEAMVPYMRGSMAQADHRLTAHLATHTEDTLGSFYLGVTKVVRGQARDAIPRLAPLATGRGWLPDEARWYLALAHLKTGDVDAARNRLEELAQAEGARKDDARGLLARLSAVTPR